MIRRAALLAGLALALIAPSGAQASSARHAYEQLWHEDAKFYAPGQPSPLVTFNTPTPGADADTDFTPGQPRTVEVARGATRGLRRGSESARSVIEWEWARVFGAADQGQAFPRPVTNALLRYRNGHGSPVSIMRSRLTYWGMNPRTIFDAAPPPPTPTCPAGWVYAAATDTCAAA